MAENGQKKPTVVFSRKDTLNAPNFKNHLRDANGEEHGEEHLIHSIDKQNSGSASPPPPQSPSGRRGGAAAAAAPAPPRQERRAYSCLRSLCCCGRRQTAAVYHPTNPVAPSAAPTHPTSEDYGSLGFPPIEGKPTLVLDLDETLVHSSFKAIPNPDFVIPVTIEGHVHHVYVLERPGTHEFLQRMSKHFEIICFTASLSKYANPLLDLLDKNKTIRGRLYREHCVFYAGTYVKDLSLIGRELRSTLIVDNSKASFLFQPECGIPCTSFIDDKSDRELYGLADWLEKVAASPDLTQVTPEWNKLWEREYLSKALGR